MRYCSLVNYRDALLYYSSHYCCMCYSLQTHRTVSVRMMKMPRRLWRRKCLRYSHLWRHISRGSVRWTAELITWCSFGLMESVRESDHELHQSTSDSDHNVSLALSLSLSRSLSQTRSSWCITFCQTSTRRRRGSLVWSCACCPSVAHVKRFMRTWRSSWVCFWSAGSERRCEPHTRSASKPETAATTRETRSSMLWRVQQHTHTITHTHTHTHTHTV